MRDDAVRSRRTGAARSRAARRVPGCRHARPGRYCSTECQRIDWRERGHRKACKKIRDERAAEAARAEAPPPPPPPPPVVYGPAPRSHADEVRARIAAEHEAARVRREENPEPTPLSERFGARCPVCYDDWDVEKNAPLLVCCCRRVCESCAKKCRGEPCPFCRAPSPKSEAESLALIRRHVENDQPDAMCMLANLYAGGKCGLVKSMKKAAKIHKRAAELGCLDSMSQLGVMMINGQQGVKQDRKKAKQLLRVAADRGHAIAQFQVAVLLNGEEIYEEAIYYFSLAAEQGHVPAEYERAVTYIKHLPESEENRNEAISSLAKAAACDFQKAKDALRAIGLEEALSPYSQWKRHPPKKVFYGPAPRSEDDDIKSWISEDAQVRREADPKGESRYGLCCPICSQEWDVNSSVFVWACCLQKICISCHANTGTDDGCPLCQAPFPDSDEDYVTQFRDHADHDVPEAVEALGCFYEHGRNGVVQSWENAKKFYERALELGNRRAMVNLGLMYKEGNGVEKDLEMAKQLWTNAADRGSAQAQVNLCASLAAAMAGSDDPDYESARSWNDRAVAQGHVRAIRMAGMMLEHGHGCTVDYVEATRRYARAASMGDEDAREEYRRLAPYGYFSLAVKFHIAKDYSESFPLFKRSADLGLKDAFCAVGNFYNVFYKEGDMGVDKDLDEAKRWYARAAAEGHEEAIANLAAIEDKERAADDAAEVDGCHS